MWLAGLIIFALGLAAGYALHYFRNPDHDRNKALQAELDALRQDGERYREQVTQHFQRTSELVQDMTHSYRAVYEHLANSSQQLCGDRVSNPRLDLPERGRLGGTPATTGDAQARPGMPRTAPPPMPEPADRDDHEETHGDVPHVPREPQPEPHDQSPAPGPQGTDKPG